MNLKLKRTLNFLSALLILVFASACQNKDIATKGNPKIDKLKLPVGFQAEHLYSPADNDQGSWVAMTFDNKGRMITADQYR